MTAGVHFYCCQSRSSRLLWPFCKRLESYFPVVPFLLTISITSAVGTFNIDWQARLALKVATQSSADILFLSPPSHLKAIPHCVPCHCSASHLVSQFGRRRSSPSEECWRPAAQTNSQSFTRGRGTGQIWLTCLLTK